MHKEVLNIQDRNVNLEIVGHGYIPAKDAEVSLAVIGGVPYNSPDTKVSMAVIGDSGLTLSTETIVTWFSS
jgi:hypothetical protein